MKKVVIERAGSYDQLQFQECELPEAKAGEVVVDVEAIGVNYADCLVGMGLYSSAKEFVGWPITPGFEVAGNANGESVIAVSLFDSYATQVLVPKHQVFPLPKGWSMAEGAAFPAVHLTAWFGLFELAHPRPGSRILVHSAAGGVGCALVRLAKLAGCTVVGVVGASHKVATVEALGADAVIDKSTQSLWVEAKRHAPNGYDIIFDANGVATLEDSYRHLAAPGKLVVYGFHTMMPRTGGRPNWLKLIWSWLRTPRFNPLDMTSENRSVLAFNLSYLFESEYILTEAMTQLLGYVDEGKLPPPGVTTFPFSDVSGAHRALESGQTTGKLVLVPGSQ